jgi:hypothetical protein
LDLGLWTSDIITPTWGGWSYDEPLVQVGFDAPRRVVINLPAGTTPQGEYIISYLPMPQPSPLYDDYETLEINVAEVLEEVQSSGAETPTSNLQSLTPALSSVEGFNLTGLILHPKRIDTADVSTPDKKGSYTFFFKDLTFYKKLPYPVKALEGEPSPLPLSQGEKGTTTAEIAGLFDMPLVKLDGQPITFQPPADQANLLDRNGYWLEPITVTLEAGLHQDGLEILPHPTFKVDLVELANKPYEPKEPTAEVSFHKVNPTRYNVDVNAWDKFWLVFSESFHPGWKAYIVENPNDQSPNPNRPWYEWSALLTWLKERGRRTELTDHYLVNAYANGWYVPQTGQYRIVLEYWPQRLFEIGVIVSVTTLLACLGYLAYDGWRSWRKRAKTGKRQNAAESVTAS